MPAAIPQCGDYKYRPPVIHSCFTGTSSEKVYGTSICVSRAIQTSVAVRFLMRPLDYVAVKGRSEPILIYELMGTLAEDTESEIAESIPPASRRPTHLPRAPTTFIGSIHITFRLAGRLQESGSRSSGTGKKTASRVKEMV